MKTIFILKSAVLKNIKKKLCERLKTLEEKVKNAIIKEFSDFFLLCNSKTEAFTMYTSLMSATEILAYYFFPEIQI